MPPTPPSQPPFSAIRPSQERQPFPPRHFPQNGGGPGGAGGRGGPPRGSQQPRRRSGFLNAIFYLFLLLLIVAGSAVAYLVINPPSDLIRQTIAEQVKAKTGRDLVVAGPAAFSFYPGVGVSLSDVSLSGPPGSNETLVRMDALTVSVKALPLLSREISVDTLILKKPLFDFRVDKSGRKNWDFADRAEPARYAQAAGEIRTDAAPPAASVMRLSKLQKLELNDVRIEDGALRYTDERSGTTQQVDSVNVKVSLPSLDSPLAAAGDLAWKGEKIDFDGTLTDPRTVFEKKPAKLVFKAKNQYLDAAFNGFTLLNEGADIEGDIKAQSSSARDLASWLGTVLPPVSGFGPMSLAGTIKTAGNVTQLSNATFGLDGATAAGNLRVTTGGVRPAINADLKISELDLNKYTTSAAGGAPPSSPARASGAKPQTPETPADSGGDAIENLLNAPDGKSQDKKAGTKVFGSTQRAGWSSEPFNLALLGVADADAKLDVDRLLFRDLKIGQSKARVSLKNRVLKTDFDDVQLYDGRGKGAISVDGTGAAAGIGANFGLQNISAQPFLKDAGGFDWLSGKSNLNLQLTANGANQLQLVETLGGKADLKFADGAIVGFNLPGIIRGISQGKLTGLNKSAAEKTDFSELGANFTIANGVAHNQDLQMVSPLLRVTGAGAVQLPQRTVDYTVKPKIVASLEGQQGDTALSGLEIPVRITGSWDKPKFEPDLKGVLSDPNKVIDAAKQIGQKLKGKNSEEIVDELFGKNSDGTESDTAKKAKSFLNKYLKPN